MKDWIIQPPALVRRLFANSLWRLPVGEKRIALTFDDGPVPEQTPWVLDVLDRYGIKATFFCVGDNVRKYPELFAELRRRGHTVGNHTFNHWPMFKHSWEDFMANVEKCNEVEGGEIRYFRAPHGHITPWRSKTLTTLMGFEKVVFWDVMPKDYDKGLTPEQVYANVRRYVRDGSLIVFHDSIKAGDRMRYALERVIEDYMAEGYRFVSLDEVLEK